MKKNAITTGALMIASTIIWGLVILGCSYKLKETGCYDEIKNILVGGIFINMILIGSPLTSQIITYNKNKEEE